MPPDRIGKYSVIRKIASGGMAEVYLCRLRGEEGFEKKVAVKIILPRFSSEPHFRDLFVREARIAAKLVHPNLVQVFDFGREGQSYFLAMEFIDGWNLAQVVSQTRTRGVSIPLPVWGHWVVGILAGIGHLHSRGIIHRDISPSNVLVSRGGLVKITDFGISRAARQQADMASGLEGKYAYLSPEQARGEEANTGSDLFAAAVISAEVYLPRRLFAEESPAETIEQLRNFDGRNMELPTLPPDVAEVVRKGLSGAPHDRYRDAEEFSQAVCAVVPQVAGRADYLAFWNDLFPGEGGEEEETITAASTHRGGDGDIVRERREGYGDGGRRRAKIGVLSALVVISAGGYVLWKELADNSRPVATPSPPVASPHPVKLPEAGSHVSHTSLPGAAGEAVRLRKTPPAATLPGPPVTAAVPPPPSRTVLIETDPTGVSISLEDGTPLGKTPLGIDLAPWLGKRIAFHKEGYVGKSVQADLLAQVTNFRLELEQQTGSIEVVQAIPWAKVFNGNKYIGDTPIHELKLPVGVHRLRFVNEPLAVEKTREITVRPGPNPKVIVLLVGERQGD
jgi:serine/threonine-protein kinase